MIDFDIIVPFQTDARLTRHGPDDGLRAELAELAHDIRAFRLYDGPTEVHKYAIARQVLR
jgi:hypothetical protein